MITELGKLTMSQYIDMLCGDGRVLLADGEQADSKALARARHRLIFEYTSIAEPSVAASALADNRGRLDGKATLVLFKVCACLVAMKAYPEVRGILSSYGVSADGMTDVQTAEEVERRLKRAKSMVGREKEDEAVRQTPEQIRLSYDRQAAGLMTYFKFQIDMDTVKATTFACMVAQADREMKARRAALAMK